MKLKKLIFYLFPAVAFASCSAVYEDLDPCPQGADVSLTFTRNMENKDLYDSQVDCAKLLLFDKNDDFYGEYEYTEGRTLRLDLPVGDYKAIVYGGMSCDNTSFLFTTTPGPGLKYHEVETYLRGTRAAESAADLHDHFHGLGAFSVEEDDMTHRPVTVDLTRNTNRFNISLSYSDNSAISASEYSFELTADNSVSNHENSVKPQGAHVTYRPHGVDTDGKTLTAHLSTPRLTDDLASRLIVRRAGQTDPVVNISLIQYIEKMFKDALPGASLQEYLDREDTWNFEFKLEPDAEDEMHISLTFKINDWTVIINSFDL